MALKTGLARPEMTKRASVLKACSDPDAIAESRIHSLSRMPINVPLLSATHSLANHTPSNYNLFPNLWFKRIVYSLLIRMYVQYFWLILGFTKVFMYFAFICVCVYISFHFVFIMVARSSVARARLPLYFAESFFLFFSLVTLSQTSENRHPETFPTRRVLVFNRTFAIPISSRCHLKRTGAEKHKICIIFHAKSQSFSAIIL